MRFVLLVDVDVELLFRLFIFMKYFLIQLFHVEILFCLTMFSFCLEDLKIVVPNLKPAGLDLLSVSGTSYIIFLNNKKINVSLIW